MSQFERPRLFQEQMERLGTMFTALDQARIDVYYEEFKNVSISTLREAVRVLIGQHPYKRFPFPAEIWSAISAVRRMAATVRYAQEAKEQLGECAKCLDQGWKRIPDKCIGETWYSFVTFCDCRIGQKRREATEYRNRTMARENPRLVYQQDAPGAVPDPVGEESLDDQFMEAGNDGKAKAAGG